MSNELVIVASPHLSFQELSRVVASCGEVVFLDLSTLPRCGHFKVRFADDAGVILASRIFGAERCFSNPSEGFGGPPPPPLRELTPHRPQYEEGAERSVEYEGSYHNTGSNWPRVITEGGSHTWHGVPEEEENCTMSAISEFGRTSRLRPMTAADITGQTFTTSNDMNEVDLAILQLHIEAVREGRDQRRTLMVRGFPKSYTQQMLVSDLTGAEVVGFCDFLYMPFNRRLGENGGCAFINVISLGAVLHFVDSFQNVEFQKIEGDGFRYLAKITYGKTQGKDLLVNQFQPASLWKTPSKYRAMLAEGLNADVLEQIENILLQKYPIAPKKNNRCHYNVDATSRYAPFPAEESRMMRIQGKNGMSVRCVPVPSSSYSISRNSGAIVYPPAHPPQLHTHNPPPQAPSSGPDANGYSSGERADLKMSGDSSSGAYLESGQRESNPSSSNDGKGQRGKHSRVNGNGSGESRDTRNTGGSTQQNKRWGGVARGGKDVSQDSFQSGSGAAPPSNNPCEAPEGVMSSSDGLRSDVGRKGSAGDREHPSSESESPPEESQSGFGIPSSDEELGILIESITSLLRPE